jgi:hypothetical protein
MLILAELVVMVAVGDNCGLLADGENISLKARALRRKFRQI